DRLGRLRPSSAGEGHRRPLRPRPGAGGRPRRPATRAATGVPGRVVAVAEAVAQRHRPRVQHGHGRLLRGLRAGRGPGDGAYNRSGARLAAAGEEDRTQSRKGYKQEGGVNYATNHKETETRSATGAAVRRREWPAG